MRTALISASNKQQLENLANTLSNFNIRLIASQGTAQFLSSKGFNVLTVEEYLQTIPLLDGRVKTLHPRLFAGILANRDNSKHMAELAQLAAYSIDFVIVDVYPFTQYQDIEHIDIGGVTLLRAAAKNFQYCTVVAEANDYDLVIDELQNNDGQTSLSFRKNMAARAFKLTSKYDMAVASWLSEEASQQLSLQKTITLSYGENPHQSADFYNFSQDPPCIKLLQGKELSYNNILDLDAGINIINEFKIPACVVVKHNNPCGVAVANSSRQAVEQAFYADEKSAFGGIVVLNQALDSAVVNFLQPFFIEVIAAPSVTEEALQLLLTKPRCKVVSFDQGLKQATQLRSALNGFLLQDADLKKLDLNNLIIPTLQKPNEATYTDIQFAFNVIRHIKSNAIMIAKNGVTLGVGCGQSNRVDAVMQAISRADQADLTGAVIASDGFFPFADSIKLIAKTPIKTIIQPGGSLRDHEVIQACDQFGISMVMTGIRTFKH